MIKALLLVLASSVLCTSVQAIEGLGVDFVANFFSDSVFVATFNDKADNTYKKGQNISYDITLPGTFKESSYVDMKCSTEFDVDSESDTKHRTIATSVKEYRSNVPNTISYRGGAVLQKDTSLSKFKLFCSFFNRQAMDLKNTSIKITVTIDDKVQSTATATGSTQIYESKTFSDKLYVYIPTDYSDDFPAAFKIVQPAPDVATTQFTVSNVEPNVATSGSAIQFHSPTDTTSCDVYRDQILHRRAATVVRETSKVTINLNAPLNSAEETIVYCSNLKGYRRHSYRPVIMKVQIAAEQYTFATALPFKNVPTN